MIKCEDCIFWQHKEYHFSNDGDCRIGRPKIADDGQHSGAWPVTQRSDGCGEGKVFDEKVNSPIDNDDGTR